MLNVSYDPTRELYQEVNAAFAADWKAKTGQEVTIQQSHGGSGKQARSVIDGLEADVVTLALAYDIDAIARRPACCRPTGRSACPTTARPTPRRSSSWCARAIPRGSGTGTTSRAPGVSVDHAQPEDLGRRALELPRRLGLRAAQARRRRGEGARSFVGRHLPQRAGARHRRARLDDHLRRARHRRRAARLGERGAARRSRSSARGKFEIVAPSMSILAEPPVAVVDKVVDRARHPRAWPRPTCEFLYTPEGQEIAAKHFYRPRDRRGRGAPRRRASRSSRCSPSTRSSAAGRRRTGAPLRRRRRVRPACGAVAEVRGRGPSAGRCRASAWRSGSTLLYLGLLVFVPLAAVVAEDGDAAAGAGLGARHLAARARRVPAHASAPRSSRRLINLVFGLLVAWVLERYRFPGRRLIDALVDLPFALPTAVAGIALASVYAENGWIGALLVAARDQGGLHAARRRGRAHLHRPALRGAHGAAGAARPRPGARGGGGDARRAAPARSCAGSCCPQLAPAAATGFVLALARALGEYGSVIFIAGNLPMKTEITPLLIMMRLEEYDYRRRDGDRRSSS